MTKFLPLCIMLFAASISVSAQTYTVLHFFGSKPGDPENPRLAGTIAQGRGGAMLTTASSRAFRITTSGSLLVLHKFEDGWPFSGLILARDGMFFGTTRGGGAFDAGTVFKMSETGTVTTLHDFAGGADGELPYAAPIQSVKGDFYGTTSGNDSLGTPPFGSVYRITEDGNFTLLHAFTGSDGASPRGPLVQGADYYFYGTTIGGGQYGDGTIFRVSSSGEFQVLVNFDGTNGKLPFAGLIEANDGNFYGVTAHGGSSNKGVLFRMRPDGVLTVLHNFTGGSDGARPMGGLVQASDGNLYGTGKYGGKNGVGVLFRAALTGDVVTLHDFDYSTGAVPEALLQHSNGIVYGTTLDGGVGGSRGDGTFYSFDLGLPPFVTYLPTYGRVGAEVLILGQDFTDTSQVFFNGTPASFKIEYPTSMKTTVPAGATTGPITVTTANGTLTSNKLFIVHP